MIVVSLIMQLICLMAIVMACWGVICARKTGEQRIGVLELLRHRPMTGMIIFKALDHVSFERHMRALMLRRDPWALYDPIVLDAIKNPRTEVIAMVSGEASDPPPAVH